MVDDKLDEAYDMISKELKMPILKIDYMPEGLTFIEAEIDYEHVVLRFEYSGKSVYLKEDKLLGKKTISILESDRAYDLKVYNDWIEKDIYIEENKLKNGDIEYSANIEGDDAFYYFSGVMEKEEFIKVVENLNYY